MLLAGRLKDLFKGKLICAQLALDDLFKDVVGVSALGSLQSALMDMAGAIDRFKNISGYNNILNGVNQALGQVNNVFSLGGLCPSPVHAPKIPDLLAQLNANLFGQANNILGALGKLSNPKMCLGGGAKGFGINWNSMPGDLKNLKYAINAFKSDPARYKATIDAFTNNLRAQTARMNSEIKRLEKNLADPLGLNEKLDTGKNIQRVKSISDGYPVRDANGILHTNVLKSMVPADIESVIDNGDKTLVNYVTKPILDYCGDVVGYEKVVITGDPKYIGWDPNGSPILNTDNPTVNPVGSYANYTYTFKQEGSVIKVYDTNGVVVTDLKLSRGIAYRLGFELTDKKIKFYSNSTFTSVWTEGLTYSRNPEYGNEMEIILPDSDTVFVRGDLDWSVLIETPNLKPTFSYTPDIIYWKTIDGSYSGSFTIDGVKEIPFDDRTYDISMAVKKASLHLVHKKENIPETTNTVQYETSVEPDLRKYSTTTTIYNSNQTIASTISVDVLSYSILDDLETIDYNGNTDPNNKIIKTITRYDNSLFLITKRYVNIENGIEFNQICFYRCPQTVVDGNDVISEVNADYCILIKFDTPISILNSSKLPYTDNYSYKVTCLQKNDKGEFESTMIPIANSDETKFDITSDSKKILWNLTSNREASKTTIDKNEFILQTDIEIDPLDTKRTFIDSDPKESRMYFYFKLDNGTAIESIISLTPNSSPNPAPGPAPSPTSAPYWIIQGGVCVMNGFAGVQTTTYDSLQACRDAGGI